METTTTPMIQTSKAVDNVAKVTNVNNVNDHIIEQVEITNGVYTAEEVETRTRYPIVTNWFSGTYCYLGRTIRFLNTNRDTISILTLVAMVTGYVTWALVISVTHNCQNPTPLIVLACALLVWLSRWFVRSKFNKMASRCNKAIRGCMLGQPMRVLRVLTAVLVLGGILVTVAITLWERPSNAWALAGIVFFFCLVWMFSAHPRKVIWRPVVMGLVLQFYMALIILRWNTGYQFLFWIGQQVQTFFEFTNHGSKFVFGENYSDHMFAMKALPMVVFFCSVIGMLSHIGVTQLIVRKVGTALQLVLGTTAPESFSVAANIFVGLIEAIFFIRPFLDQMTRSELTAMMTGGFSTIAGSLFAVYISMGVPAVHLLCASVMSAPCALAVSKLLYPETEESRFKDGLNTFCDGEDEHGSQESGDYNILSAASTGATTSIKLVTNICVNAIAFVSLLAMLNALLSWLGGFLCYPDLSFQIICSYLLRPVAFLMGVRWKDAGKVAELIGIKTLLTDFVAYNELAKLIDDRHNCLATAMSVKSEAIATYALCGFSNICAIGIALGSLNATMNRSRRGVVSQLVIRAMFGGVVTCLMTATVAGLLIIEPEETVCSPQITGDVLNSSFLGNQTDIQGFQGDFLTNTTAVIST